MKDGYKIDLKKFEFICKKLADETLSCPPPYDLTDDEYCRDCPAPHMEKQGIEFTCADCWALYLKE